MRRIAVTLAVVVALLFGAGIADNPHAEETTFGVNGINFAFDPGENYCAADPKKYPNEKVVLDYFRQSMHGQIYVLGVFSDVVSYEQ